MSRPKYAGKSRKKLPAPLEGVLVPAKADEPIIRRTLANNPELERYAALTTMHILQTWSALATVDVSEIVRVTKDSCRFCHGIDHRYQWSAEDEWAERASRAIDIGKEPPNCDGGFGFDPRKEPHQECPACHGRGEDRVELTDHRTWSAAARLLYNGAKHGKYGIEIMLRDRDKLLELAGKHLGMFKDIHEHTGKNGGAMQVILSATEAAL